MPILKKPRYVVFGFQTARKDVRVEDASKFDKCHATDMRLHLNTQIFPYQRNELDIEGGIYSELYNAYANIQYSYYNNTDPTNLIELAYGEFQDNTLFVFDTSRADESLINSAVDIKLEIKSSQDIPANTNGYLLIIYDEQVQLFTHGRHCSTKHIQAHTILKNS